MDKTIFNHQNNILKNHRYDKQQEVYTIYMLYSPPPSYLWLFSNETVETNLTTKKYSIIVLELNYWYLPRTRLICQPAVL